MNTNRRPAGRNSDPRAGTLQGPDPTRADATGRTKGAANIAAPLPVRSFEPRVHAWPRCALPHAHPHSEKPHTWHFTHPSANSSCEPQSGHVPMNDSLPPPFADSNVIWI